MKCEICNENDSSVKYTVVDENGTHLINICPSCAVKRGIPLPEDTPKKSAKPKKVTIETNEILSRLDMIKSDLMTDPVQCENCGLFYSEFSKQGRLGCVDCYKSFANELEQFIYRSHSKTVYQGHMKQQIEKNKKDQSKILSKSQLPVQHQLEILRVELDLVVQEERYEQAAKLRDQIRDLEKEFTKELYGDN